MYCKRHNIVCQDKGCGVMLRKEEAGKHVHCFKCNKTFQHEEIEKHMKVFHEPSYCGCGVILEKEEMVSSVVLFFLDVIPFLHSFSHDFLFMSCDHLVINVVMNLW